MQITFWRKMESKTLYEKLKKYFAEKAFRIKIFDCQCLPQQFLEQLCTPFIITEIITLLTPAYKASLRIYICRLLLLLSLIHI